MGNIAQNVETLHFNGIVTPRLQSSTPHTIISSCDNAYFTIGNYGDNWAISIQIRDPKIGDTVQVRWNSIDDNEPVYGRFMVRKHGDGLEIIADVCSDHMVHGAGMCRVVDTYGYVANMAYYIGGSRDTVEVNDYAF